MKKLFCLFMLAVSTLLQGEQTLSLIKPDAVAGRHLGDILCKFENNGLDVVALKMVRLNPAQAGEFYAVHKGKPFYNELVNYMSSGPLVAIVLDGKDAVAKYRQLMGTTDPQTAAPGTIRAEFAESKGRNAVHGSDSPEAAKTEIAFFFTPEDIVPR